MNTITGKVEDAAANPLTVYITFALLTFPQSLATGSVIVPQATQTVQTNPNDGTFTIQLLAGYYTVTVGGSPTSVSTPFTIAVVGDGNTYNIGSIISSPAPAVPGTPPNTLFNGLLAGNFNFIALTPPVAPTVARVAFAGGSVAVVGDELYAYWFSYVTQNGQTILGPILQANEAVLGGTASNVANRISIPSAPSTATAVNIWRSYVDNGHTYGTAQIFPNNIGLLATTAPNVPYYDDWESTAQFAARVNLAITVPVINTTAGQIQTNGVTNFILTTQGVKSVAVLTAPNQILNGDPALVMNKGLLDTIFGGSISTSDVLFRFSTGQFQFSDQAAKLITPTTIWSGLGVNAGATVWGSLTANTAALDNPFSIPGGANYRFANGQHQFYDAAQAVSTPTTPWRAITVNSGAIGWSAPIATAGATLDTLPNPVGANWRVKNGQYQLWDAAQAMLDMSRPWRALSVSNGASIVSNPISL